MIIRPSSRTDRVQTYYFAIKLAEIAQMNAAGLEVINLGIGSPDLQPPPSVISKLQEASSQSTANKYQSYKGLPDLRQAFASWYKRHFDINLDASTEILPLIGSKEGIMHIAMSFLEKGDEVLVPNPGYPAYRMTSLLADASPLNYDLTEENEWFPNFEEIEKQDLSKVKIMWVNYPNMPTGKKGNMDLFEELVAFGLKHHILICHDNPYGFILNEEPMSILQVDGAREVCIELNSLSKCFNMAGWRVGMMASSKEYIDTVMKFKSNMDSGMYRPIQEAAIEALQYDEGWFNSLNEVYTERKEVALRIAQLLDCVPEKNSAGLFVWARIPDHIESSEVYVEDILQGSKVFITPGFIFGTNGDRYIRISLCAETDVLNNAFHRIKSYLEVSTTAV